MSAILQKAIRDVSKRVDDVLYLPQFDEADIDLQALRTARELLRVLAKTVGGMDMRTAFGAPGDWGYGNELGQGVLQLLTSPQSSSEGRSNG